MKAKFAGSGDIDIEGLEARTGDIILEGSGDIIATVKESVDATLRGSGDITIYGSPVGRNTKKTGSGKIKFK